MQDIQLKTPGIDGQGALRHPAEGVITIDDDTAERWRGSGLLDEEPDDDGLDALKLDELKKGASDETVDLAGATTKADIVAAIRAHRAA